MVELHQLVQGGEELVPHIVLTAAVLKHLEMLDVVAITVKKGKRQITVMLVSLFLIKQKKSATFTDRWSNIQQLTPTVFSFVFLKLSCDKLP